MKTEDTLKTIDRLVEAGYITVEKQTDNPFYDVIQVTEKGKRVLDWGNLE